MKLFARLLSAGLLLVAGSLHAQAKDNDLVTAMATLDKAYIPALGLTGQGDVTQAQAALTKFEAAWKAFKAQTVARLGTEPGWKADQTALDDVVSKAHDLVINQKKNPEAHEALEEVRKILLATRERMGVPYFVDSLTRFHNAMETYLGEKDASINVLKGLAQEVRKAEPLLPAYGLSAAATKAYSEQWAQMVTLLGSVTGDTEKAKVKPLFIKTFFLFGDFPSKK